MNFLYRCLLFRYLELKHRSATLAREKFARLMALYADSHKIWRLLREIAAELSSHRQLDALTIELFELKQTFTE